MPRPIPRDAPVMMAVEFNGAESKSSRNAGNKEFAGNSGDASEHLRGRDAREDSRDGCPTTVAAPGCAHCKLAARSLLVFAERTIDREFPWLDHQHVQSVFRRVRRRCDWKRDSPECRAHDRRKKGEGASNQNINGRGSNARSPIVGAAFWTITLQVTAPTHT